MPNLSGQAKAARPAVWILALALLLAALLLVLPGMDTATRELAMSVLRYGDGAGALLLFGAAGFGLQLWAERLRRFRRTVWLLPAFSAVLVAVSELIWQGGGWERLLSGFLTVFALPLMLGSSAAELFLLLCRQSARAKAAAAVALAAAVVLGFYFWPRPLGDKTEMALQARMLYFEPEEEGRWMQVRDPGALSGLLRRVKVTPCLSLPDWNGGRGVLLRLNDRCVLVARYDGSSWVCDYAGPLEEFDGGAPRWRIFGYSALYGELRTSADWAEGS